MIGKNPRITEFFRGIPRQTLSTVRPSSFETIDQGTPWSTWGWPTSTPEAQGMESRALADYVILLSEPTFHVDSLLLVRRGYIVTEAYYHPYQRDTRCHTYSVSKSVLSALIGIAIQQGHIESVEQPVLDFFPNMTIANVDARKKALTLEHLLTMTSGLACDWAFGTSVDNAMRASHDWVQFALSLPMMAEPGVEFHYCNANAHLLSAIITKQTGMSALEYAHRNIFAPLGITEAAWTSSPTGISHGAGELQLMPRDMAKFGYLYLRKGQWEGQQIVPAAWVATSTSQRVPYLPDFGYGYMWWTMNTLNAGMAVGFGGQHIWFFPGLDLVAVLTGGATDDLRLAYRLPPILSGLLRLTISDHPLPEDPSAFARLQAARESVASPKPSPLPPLPEIARRISGKTYHLLSPNLLTVPGHIQFRVPEGMGVSAWETQALNLTFDGSEATLTLTFADAEQMGIAVGLNGLSRTTPGRLGVVGARGEWLTDTSFRLYLQHVGDCTRYRMDMTFTNTLLEVVAFETAAGEAHVVFGLATDE